MHLHALPSPETSRAMCTLHRRTRTSRRYTPSSVLVGPNAEAECADNLGSSATKWTPVCVRNVPPRSDSNIYYPRRWPLRIAYKARCGADPDEPRAPVVNYNIRNTGEQRSLRPSELHTASNTLPAESVVVQSPSFRSPQGPPENVPVRLAKSEAKRRNRNRRQTAFYTETPLTHARLTRPGSAVRKRSSTGPYDKIFAHTENLPLGFNRATVVRQMHTTVLGR